MESSKPKLYRAEFDIKPFVKKGDTHSEDVWKSRYNLSEDEFQYLAENILVEHNPNFTCSFSSCSGSIYIWKYDGMSESQVSEITAKVNEILKEYNQDPTQAE